MKNVATTLLALCALLLASPAIAQIEGRWITEYGDTTWLEIDNRSNVRGRTPPWISTNISLPGQDNRVLFDGAYRNLVWEGYWTFYGTEAPRGVVWRPCARPHNIPDRRATNRYGRFRVTFNAAENRFEGTMSNCDLPTTPGSGGTQPFVGTRENTYAYSAPDSSPPETRDVPFLPFNPGPPPEASPEEEAAMAASAAERDCEALRDNLPITWSTAFATRPCIINAGDDIEIITREDQAQRPMTVIYRAFHAFDIGHRGLVRTLRLEARRGLAFQGVPRAATLYRGQFDLALCREGTWLVSLLMSDGTETPPIGLIETGDERAPLLGRGCDPGSHTHEPDDFVEPVDLRLLEPIRPRGG